MEKKQLLLNALMSVPFANKTSLAYKSVSDAIHNPGTPVIIGKNTGSGRYSSSIEWTEDVDRILRAICASLDESLFVYEYLNIAPRKGKNGWRLIINY